jgi:hypothetical protein
MRLAHLLLVFLDLVESGDPRQHHVRSTLVDRKAEGDNHSHRYLVEFNDVMAMEVQLRFVLDQKNRVVLVEIEGVQYK